MRSLLAFAAIATFITPIAAAAAPPDAPRPLRSLVYDVQYSAHSRHDKKTSGFNGGFGGDPGGGAPGVSSGSGTASVALDGSDSGRLTIDVIAATADRGLVVDVAYAGKVNSQPTIRVALFPDGRLSADPSKALGTEALHILPLLARDFIAGRTVQVGAEWSIPAPPPAKGTTTYHVRSIDGDFATLALQGSLTVAGVNGFDETAQGTTRYATSLVTPVSYDVTSKIRRQVASDETITTDAHLVATLVSDTFRK